jgi:hypothetical protein
VDWNFAVLATLDVWFVNLCAAQNTGIMSRDFVVLIEYIIFNIYNFELVNLPLWRIRGGFCTPLWKTTVSTKIGRLSLWLGRTSLQIRVLGPWPGRTELHTRVLRSKPSLELDQNRANPKTCQRLGGLQPVPGWLNRACTISASDRALDRALWELLKHKFSESADTNSLPFLSDEVVHR